MSDLNADILGPLYASGGVSPLGACVMCIFHLHAASTGLKRDRINLNFRSLVVHLFLFL